MIKKEDECKLASVCLLQRSDISSKADTFLEGLMWLPNSSRVDRLHNDDDIEILMARIHTVTQGTRECIFLCNFTRKLLETSQ